MPDSITPMSATLAAGLPRGEDWLFEIKWDGVRALCFLADERLTVYSRNGNRCDPQYPELTVVPHYIAAGSAILDGEIAVLDDKGISRFELIQPRIANTDANAVAHLARSRPVTLFLFDLLYLDGYDLRQCPLHERKRALAAIVSPGGPVRVSEHFMEGEAMLDAARQAGLEGLIAKRASSCYEPRRSREWLKLKLVNQQEFLICGYTAGERDYFGALVLGAWEGGRLVWVGNVGTGFDRRNMEDLHRRMQPLIAERAPFAAAARAGRDITWLRPALVAMVKFANWTQDDRLRAPVFLGLRHDVDPARVTREPAAAPPEPARRGPLLSGGADEVSLQVDGKTLKLTHLNKLYYPDDGIAKRDVLNYYDAVAPLILPHLKDRPLSLKRYVEGIRGEYFFQKNMAREAPQWLRTVPIHHDETKGATHYALADDRAALLYLTNLGSIDQNPWMSRLGSLEHPDFILIDLDPQECPFDMIVEAALLVKKQLDALGLAGYPKTTGGDGMHIYIPLEPVYSFDDSRNFAELIGRLCIAERPGLFTTPRTVARREKGRVYFDWLQNSMIKTIAAPYALRAHPGAPVSTPLAWREVKKGISPLDFTIRNAPDRFARVGDLFAGVLEKPQRLEPALDTLAASSRTS
jgi:bifunctional non-homologous end joining protein LigD